VYDSFSGVPDIGKEDAGTTLKRGSCAASVEEFLDTTRGFQPVVHRGWFKDTLPAQLPPAVCFGFLDGDLYQSIATSLQYVCPRLVQHGVVLVHDYTRDWLPGVRRACHEFLTANRNFASNQDSTGHLVITRMY
jgi:O-methyltransferase